MSLQSTPRPLNGATNAYHVNTRAFDDEEAIGLGPRRIIAKIDGLFIGLKLANEVDGSSINPPAGGFTSHSLIIENPEVPIQDRNPLYTELGTVQDASSTGPERMLLGQHLSENSSRPNYDWSSILEVRAGMEEIWQRLGETLERSSSPQILAVQMLFQNFRDFCDAGVLSIRATLTGAIPNQLREVFALTSMAFVVSDLLRKTGQLSSNDIWKDIRTWRNAIVNLHEQNTFHLVVEILWPVAGAHFYTLSATYSDPYLDQLSTYEFNQNNDLNGSSWWLQGPIRSNEEPFFGELTFNSAANLQAYHASQEASMPPTSLRDTDAFRAIQMYCSHMGELPYLLSGNGMTAKDVESSSAFIIENSQTRDRMNRVLLEPLQSRSGSTNRYFQALLSAVESFVERGCLQSIGEAGNFMFTVGKVS